MSLNWLKDGLRFCGVEIMRGSDGEYHLHQTSYLSDLVSRYTLPVESSLPDFETGYEEEETLSIPILRRAQKLVGYRVKRAWTFHTPYANLANTAPSFLLRYTRTA